MVTHSVTHAMSILQKPASTEAEKCNAIETITSLMSSDICIYLFGILGAEAYEWTSPQSYVSEPLFEALAMIMNGSVFPNREKLRKWLRVVAFHKFVDANRRHKSYSELPIDICDNRSNQSVDMHPEVSELLAATYCVDPLLPCILKLRFQGLNFTEIAQELKITPDKVKRLIRRLREWIAKNPNRVAALTGYSAG